MNRLVKKFASSVLAIAVSASLAACGGGSHGAAMPQMAPTVSPAPSYNGPLADATLTITVPVPTTTSSTRRPAYVSSSTSKIVFTLNTTTNPNITPAQVTAFNASQLGAKAVTLGSAPCTGTGPWTCTITIKLPPGSDNITVSAQDASSNILSQQIQTFTVTAGGSAAGANNFSLILDANAATMALSASSGYCAGGFTVSNGQTVPTVGTSPVTFNASYTDLAGKTIVGPGLPLLKVNGSSTSGTITGTGGNVNFTVNQAAQTIALTATTTSTSASIPVTVTHADSNGTSDGLTLTQALSFTFQSGPAPPSSFLASAEQVINSSGVTTGGRIDLFTVNLASDTFAAYSPSSLAVQPGPSGSNYNNSDVDFPNDLIFDANGDLLIANGGGSVSGVDFGNFACVPAGAITTGANAATVIPNGTADDPVRVVLGTDNSVALTNGAFTTYSEIQYLLNGTYSAAPTTRDINQSANGTPRGIVALPTTAANPAGTYAVGLQIGSQGAAKVQIIHPNGTTTNITDPEIADPWLGYDAANSQLVIATDGRGLPPTGNYAKSNIQFWTVGATPTKVKEFYVEAVSGAATAIPTGPVAVSPDGHVAIIAMGGSGYPELVVYDNTANRNKVSGTLDYGATDCATQTNYTYGGTTVSANVANKVLWLSNTKLLVQLYSQSSHIATSVNGLYIYDITQTMPQGGCDVNIAPEPTPTVKQTGFQALTNAPLAAAYRP